MAHVSQSHQCWRCLGIDSSPKLGWNWLVTREDRFVFEFCEGDDFLALQLNSDFNKIFESRLCPLSTLGRGRAGLVTKTAEQ